MSKRVKLNLIPGDLHNGFAAVTVQLSTDDDYQSMQITGSLPPAPEIEQLYRRWQLLYQALSQRLSRSRRIEFETQTHDVIQVSEVEFQQLCQQLQTSINTWLNSQEFRPIDQKLRRELNPRDEIQVIVETNDDLLRRLPWHLWDFFEDYPGAELAVSALDYAPIKPPPRTRRGIVRILAVLGHSAGIDIQTDRRVLERLPGVELVFLQEPRRRQLDEYLWDKKGWDILFFAGHSQTEGETGRISINPQDSLTIPQLKHALRHAIAAGLQLAIFNSCDGLGLARQLADLQIPYITVMREPVPDGVAQAFLQYFLASFAREPVSLHLAVRQARERLECLEDDCPCACWLPVIGQNPAAKPLTWQQLRGRERRRLHVPLMASAIATLFVIGMRSLGWLQIIELQALDQLIRLRSDEGIDSRLLVVEGTEEDVNRYGYPLPDGILADVIEKLEENQPRVLGLDIFRDRPVKTGHGALMRQFQQNHRLIGLCSVKEANNPNKPTIAPPPGLSPDRLGYSDVVVDPDGVIRRHLMFMQPSLNDACATNYSLSVRLALRYLAVEGIEPQTLDRERVQVGNVVFKDFQGNIGAYHRLDTRGFQVLLNYRDAKDVAHRVSVTQVLQGQVNPDWVKDKVILIGMSAPTASDEFFTPYSASELPYRKMPGVVVQAQMVSQILSAVLDGRPLLWVLPTWGEWVWIWVASGVAGIMVWRWRHSVYGRLVTVGAIAVLYVACFGVLIVGGWMPLVPSALALIFTGSLIIAYSQLHR